MVPSPQVVSVLEPLRQHRDAEVTEAVAELLSRAIAVSSVDDARRLLDSQDSTERRAALLYFSSQRDEKAAQVLVSFLSAGTKANWNRLGLRRAYTCLGKMRSHHGHAYLEKLLSAKGLTGRLKSSPDEQILAVRGLVSANDAFAKKLLDMVMNEKQFSGPVRLALTRMRDSKRRASFNPARSAACPDRDVDRRPDDRPQANVLCQANLCVRLRSPSSKAGVFQQKGRRSHPAHDQTAERIQQRHRARP